LCAFIATSFYTAAEAQELNVRKPQVIDGYSIVDFAIAGDGGIWLIEKSKTNQRVPEVLVEIDSFGKQKEYKEGLTAPAGDGVRMLAIAPDGSVWFLEAGKIGRRSPQGKIEEFSVAIDDDTRISSLTVGPDGNLWFVRPKSIGKITQDGVVTQYQTGRLPPSFLLDITYGLDGSIWFTDKENLVGKIAQDGAMKEFKIGAEKPVMLGSIVTGPEGNMWFTVRQGNSIGKITPQGLVTTYFSIIGGRFFIQGLAAGPDNNIWYTVPRRNVLGRVSVDGKVSEYPIKSAFLINDAGVKESVKVDNFYVSKITFSPKGELWFLDEKNGFVGRIDPPYKIDEGISVPMY